MYGILINGDVVVKFTINFISVLFLGLFVAILIKGNVLTLGVILYEFCIRQLLAP